MSVTLIQSIQAHILVPLLRDAEEGDERIMEALRDPAITAYLASDNEQPVGAVVIRWSPEDSEIIYIATDSHLRGRGYGKAMIQAVVEEAHQRGVEAVSVGTANSSWDNIAFYQKCGFRMYEVRRDYFDYLPSPLYEDGIQMTDMLVLRKTLSER